MQTLIVAAQFFGLLMILMAVYAIVLIVEIIVSAIPILAILLLGVVTYRFIISLPLGG